jgi:hypothetical protein
MYLQENDMYLQENDMYLQETSQAKLHESSKKKIQVEPKRHIFLKKLFSRWIFNQKKKQSQKN